ncbi:hypothetical protein E2C01_050811 [Portunus trituberculatus]|uniref:Uncharacterized protein n=1 Tax=Portunus trituberculatus TaxID=210409 RepID=A0A5B7GHC4_PORTR|nr:hypothetical protein [Portunus trituberculatus]
MNTPLNVTVQTYKGGGGEVVSVGSGRRPRVGSNLASYHFEAMPFVEWFKVTYMSA